MNAAERTKIIPNNLARPTRPAPTRTRPRAGRNLAVGLTAAVAAAALTTALVRRRVGRLRFSRGLAAVQLVLRGGVRYASNAPRLFAAAGEHRQQLRNDLALQTAEDVTATLGAMKGVLVKLGQMASYVDDGLAPSVRRTLTRLQDSVPPMSPELAAAVDQRGARRGRRSRCSRSGIPSPSRPPPSARCTARSPTTAGPSP